MKLNNAAAATSGIISGMTRKVRNPAVKRLVSRNASANSRASTRLGTMVPTAYAALFHAARAKCGSANRRR
jgi:hypothetical protein